jgi:hypothetical protein
MVCQPLANTPSAALIMSSSVMVLLITLRSRCEPVSGAKVALRPPRARATLRASVWPNMLARKDGSDRFTLRKDGSSTRRSVRGAIWL